MSDSPVLHGIGVSPGISVGPAVVLRGDLPSVPERVVPSDAVEREVARLHDAVDSVRRSLEDLRERVRGRVGPEEAKIFDAQIEMLQDVEFLQGVERLIRDNQLAAERAFEFKALEMRAVWANSASGRLRERVADLTGIQVRVLNYLLGSVSDDILQPAQGRPAIVITKELSPILTVQFGRDRVIGFVSEEGTRTSHGAILARSLGIPCVMGLTDASKQVETGAEVIIDGMRGTVTVAPTEKEIAAARELEERRKVLVGELEAVVGQPAVTVDGERVVLQGNLDLPEELDQLVHHGAEGVGLMRTEFLVVGRSDLPDESEQLGYFRRVARRFPNAPIIIRTYDVGGDKFPSPFRIPPEANPFLGWRALRVCLDHPEMLLTQLRALLRARLDGDIQLLLPLVIEPDEVRQVRHLISEAKESLARDGIRAASDIPVGVTVETPAAVIISDLLLKESDFLSVGTNDLTQYTLALDRGNARLARRFSPLHPAVIRLLRDVREAAARAGKPIAVCGELAGEPLGSFLLVGLGYRLLSVSPPTLPLVRWLVRQFDAKDAAAAVREAMEVDNAAAVSRVLEEHLSKIIDLHMLDAGWLPKRRAQTTLR